MKTHFKNISVFTLLFFSLTFFACNKNECPGETSRNFPVSQFTSIQSGDQHEITILYSDSFKVSAQGCSNDINDLVVEVVGEKLIIRYPSFKKHRHKVSLLITMPSFSAAWFSGQTKATVTGFSDTTAKTFNLSGQSRCTYTGQASSTQASISGQSEFTQHGLSSILLLNISGQSTYYGFGVFANQFTNVSVSGQSEARVFANGTLIADASGQSTVLYRGYPVNKQFSTSGASKIVFH